MSIYLGGAEPGETFEFIMPEGPGLAHGQHHPKAGKPRRRPSQRPYEPEWHRTRRCLFPLLKVASFFLPGREDELVVEPDREPKEELREH